MATFTCKNCGRDYEGSKGAGFWKWFCSNRCKDEYDERNRQKAERASGSRRENRRVEPDEQERKATESTRESGVKKQDTSDIGCLRSIFNLAGLILLIWIAYNMMSK